MTPFLKKILYTKLEVHVHVQGASLKSRCAKNLLEIAEITEDDLVNTFLALRRENDFR